MARTRRSKQEEVHVPITVVRYLGRISSGAMLIGGFLTWRVVETSASSTSSVDAAVVGLVTAFIGFGAGGINALGAILASTRTSSAPVPGEPGAAPVDVNVKNTPRDPVPTEPQTPDGAPAAVAAPDDTQPPAAPAADAPPGDSADSTAVTDQGASA